MANGIPVLLNKVAKATNTVQLLTADAAEVQGMFSGTQWGIFNADGTLALAPDSIIDLDFKAEWMIANAPQEQGSFQSYSKVQTPASVNLRMTKGGTVAEREAFLSVLAGLAGSLNMLYVLMPEGKLIENVNIVRVDFRRTATNGVGLLTVNVALQEVRTAPSPILKNTARPSGADPINAGTVQALPATLYGLNAAALKFT